MAYKTARMGLESTRRFHTTAHTMTLRGDRKRGEAGRSGSPQKRRR